MVGGILTIWNVDKKLIPNMQESFFEYYNFAGIEFWTENYNEVKRLQTKVLDVNEGSFYFKCFLEFRKARSLKD